MSSPNKGYGVVAIGRNEGERLRQCLHSVLRHNAAAVVYVDSGSTDGSVEFAGSMGAHVVNLELSVPFTAARARNAGFEYLLRVCPDLAFVLFVDGDCEVASTWMDTGHAFLAENPTVVAVTGRVRERHPERSIYNTLCDLDWQWATGETQNFGGNVLLRAEALRQEGGYKPDLIAGEEPELCIRLRRAGWKIWHLDTPMTLHDANILHFSQWWRRAVRTGWAYAEGAAMYGGAPERHWVRETWSACIWGLGVPLVALAAVLVLGWPGLAVLALYPLQWWRMVHGSTLEPKLARLRSTFLIVGKFAEAKGVLKFAIARFRGSAARLIEYK